MFGLAPLPVPTGCPAARSASSAAGRSTSHNDHKPTVNRPGTPQTGIGLRSVYMDDLVQRRSFSKQQQGGGGGGGGGAENRARHPVVSATAAVNAAGLLFIRGLGLTFNDPQSSTPGPDALISALVDRLPALEPLLQDMLTPLAAQLAGLRGRLAVLRAQQSPDQRGNEGDGDAPRPLDETPTTEEELRRIAACLRSYSEEEYEDSVQWMKCLFVCRYVLTLSL